MLTWTLVLFFFCSAAATPGLRCDWLEHYGHYSNWTLVLVEQLGGPMTEQESPVSFPYRLYEQMRSAKVDDRLLFIRDSLDLISGLFEPADPSVSLPPWQTDRSQDFLLLLHRQTDGLKPCVAERKRERRLRRYYRKLRKTLQKTGGAAVSWELIRRETKSHLLQLDLLFASIRGSAAASRGRSAAH
ncbi:interferon a3-like [Myripristis murdjan]|uniref:Interferon a3-like n=1 Tax=Myripristis murdjan TaxID=586833 RepID=A0A667X546_9TELE|nr:interferon a3-like [Myripristis murdjan]